MPQQDPNADRPPLAAPAGAQASFPLPRALPAAGDDVLYLDDDTPLPELPALPKRSASGDVLFIGDD